MKVAIFESIVTPAGHEHDFDRILVQEMQKLGHQVEFFVPEDYPFKIDYGVPVSQLKGQAVSYAGSSGLRKILLSAKREIRRLHWFNELYRYTQTGRMDAIIIPTATYRFLRSIRFSQLKRSSIPIIPIMHGINPGEAARFFHQTQMLQHNPQIKMAVITLGSDIFGKKCDNIGCIRPPVFPKNSELQHLNRPQRPLTLGFFGQYRREKNLEGFLAVFCRARFDVPVQLLVQGATVLPEDGADFERIQQLYGQHSNIQFLHRALIGKEWQQAIDGVDALIMPYASERYRYHWSAMLFTAIGFDKPVIIADSINPEVMNHYPIGVSFLPQGEENLQQALETFVNTYAQQQAVYQSALLQANLDFSPQNFVTSLMHKVTS